MAKGFEPGIKFINFAIQNGRVFKNVDVPLAKQGIVSILGKNGTGKSTIWNLFQATIFNTTPYGHKKDDLVKNDKDATFTINFEKSLTPHTLSFQRRKKKWGYVIEKDKEDRTPHTYNDAVKASGDLLGLTAAEFEGSIHLTQGNQHILISGKPAKRKEYISNFFGIDTSYDLVHQESKAKLTEVKNDITKLSALSHTKAMLEQEIEMESYQDPEPLEDVLQSYEQRIQLANLEIEVISFKKAQHQNYERYYRSAAKYDDPESFLIETEEKLVKITSQIMSASDIVKSNKNAHDVNRTINRLEKECVEILGQDKDIENYELDSLQDEIETMVKQKNASDTVKPLREELAGLPDLKALPLERVEEEYTKIKVECQASKRKLVSIRKGECSECGSQFDTLHIEEVEATTKDLEESLEILGEDLQTIKERNVKALRRANILKTVDDIPEWNDRHEQTLKVAKAVVPLKKSYDENLTTLNILQRQEIQDEPNTALLKTEQDELRGLIKEIKVCIEAVKALPEKPEESLDEVLAAIDEQNDVVEEVTAKKNEAQQTLGKVKAANERIKRLQVELTTLVRKLSKVEGLKKQEFFWAKIVDAYGPRGLRVRQLEKMMNLVIRQLPVYTSILFNEKGLTFKHRCDATSVEIIACREEVDKVTGEIRTFEHDISSFSGGEKGKMSTAFVLTLADCVPPAKRSNILILDEVDSALDADGQFRFTNDLLPMLRENYESVFVVSHSQEIQQAAVYDQVWTLKKNNHWSEIEVGTLT